MLIFPASGEYTDKDIEALLEYMPEEFRTASNRWYKFSIALRFQGGGDAGWKWRDESQKIHQSECLKSVFAKNGVIFSMNYANGERASVDALAGWLLSEMLEEIPPLR